MSNFFCNCIKYCIIKYNIEFNLAIIIFYIFLTTKVLIILRKNEKHDQAKLKKILNLANTLKLIYTFL